MNQSEAEAVAKGLTEAQRRAVLTEGFGALWATIEALREKRVIAVRTCFPDGKGITLTPLGLQIRSILTRDEP